MIIQTIELNNQDVTTEVFDLGGLSASVSDAWEISGGKVDFSLYDPDRVWFAMAVTAPDDRPLKLWIVAQDDSTAFLGEIEAGEVTWDQTSGTTRMSAADPFARAKNTEIVTENWQRPGVREYLSIGLVNPDGSPLPYLQLETVENLWPGDTLSTRFENDEGGRTTLSIEIVQVMPEFGQVRLERAPREMPPPGTLWQRENHEPRFVALGDAVARLEQDLNGSGTVPVTLIDEIKDLHFEEPALYPFPVPQKPDTAGSVLLQGAADGERAMAVYITRTDTGVQRSMVRFNREDPPEFFAWTYDPTGNAAPYPLDWVRDLAQPPAALLPPLKQHRRAGFQITPTVLNGPPQALNLTVHTAVDLQNQKAYELRGSEGDWLLVAWTWNGSDWAQPDEIRDFEGLHVRGLTFDHARNQLWLAVRDLPDQPAATIRGLSLDGVLSPTAMTFESVARHGLGMLGLARILYAEPENGRRLAFYQFGGEKTVLEVDNDMLLGHTLTLFQEDLFVISIGRAGTLLHRYREIDGQWVEQEADLLSEYAPGQATLTHAGGMLWVGLNGQLWVRSTTYKPMLVKADVAGMNVAEVLQNILFLGHAYLNNDLKGTVTLTPKPAAYPHLGAIHDPVRLSVRANWSEHYQRIVVTGRHAEHVGIATTGIAGDEWKVDCDFVESGTHAAAIARLLLDYHKPKRREVTLTEIEIDRVLPLQVLTIDGADYLVRAIEEPLALPGAAEAPLIPREIEAVEVIHGPL